uniref:ATPase AAA-type core domain-containing protein n=1 Tax=Solibacter usitatus (strain Ellin6076) TaxID=234267 RepID=Q025B4_SOLUE
MIKSLKAVQLNRRMTFELSFHPDLNVVTGKNGSGKTTLLKLLWYVISGNLERIIPEITFESFDLVTDEFEVGMSIEGSGKQRIAKLRYRAGDFIKETERPFELSFDWDDLEITNREIVNTTSTSIFFPTFRRIEGGFSIPSRDEDSVRFNARLRSRETSHYRADSEHNALQRAMDQLSARLTVQQHRFVASISTHDIVRLLTSQYAEVSETTNRLHMDLSNFILKTIRGVSGEESRHLLSEIQTRARSVTERSELLLRPFTVLSGLIAQVFQYKGIKLADPITLGEAREAIASDLLSAGEKQMLSFLCYNAFANQASIFIDEPEISLHVDWQRILFPLLLDQSTGNQFIIATHSPFIYSKFADKELALSSDRGE